MTLFRELIIAVLLLFIVLYAGNVAVSLRNNKLLVAEQMQVHAQDTATALGLAMTQAAQENDMATMETLFNAVSDSGYFQRIFFTNLQGEITIDREFPINVEGIPDWFVSIVGLPSSEGRALVAAGWIQLGELSVVSHPGQAYLRLWNATLTQLSWFAIVTALVCLLAYVALKILLEPLRRVERQADAIFERRFEVQDKLPRTRELRRVVEAMNRMSERLKAIFTEQMALINRLREQSSTDDVTGLYNRRNFDARFNSFVSPETGSHAGVLLIIVVRDLDVVNKCAGREEGNAVLKTVAKRLREAVETYPRAIVARHQGPEFAVFIPDITLEEAERASDALFHRVMTVEWPHIEQCPLKYNMGFSYQQEIVDGSEMLREVDMALRQATASGSNQWCRFSDVQDGEAPVLGRPLNAWREFLEQCLSESQLILHYQPIYSIDGESLRGQEVFVRFPNGDEVISAGVVVPIAERLGMMPELDMLMLSTLANSYKSHVLTGKIVVNLSLVSLQSDQFITDLDKLLKSNKKLAKVLVVEVAEHGMEVDQPHIRDLQTLLKKRRVELAIDHFGLETTAFGYLGSLPLFYLKVHRSFTHRLDENPDNQFYIESLLQLTHNNDMELWVEGVETEEEWQQLQLLKVDAVQGYFLGKPSPNPVEGS